MGDWFNDDRYTADRHASAIEQDQVYARRHQQESDAANHYIIKRADGTTIEVVILPQHIKKESSSNYSKERGFYKVHSERASATALVGNARTESGNVNVEVERESGGEWKLSRWGEKCLKDANQGQ